MGERTFVIGDIHGELGHLRRLVSRMPDVGASDTVVFLGDYVDRGPRSREVVDAVRGLDRDTGCKVVCLRGNHEDAWLRVVDEGWPGFVLPPGNGCIATLNAYRDADANAPLTEREYDALFAGSFFPDEVIAWFRALPLWYEDEHAIYVHAGLTSDGRGGFLHPRDTKTVASLLWTRTESFFRDYRGKRVVVGHTHTMDLPNELSTYTVDDPTDVWAGPCVTALDTGCGRDGFLTALELPAMKVYESR
jgi:serine/threonine protein phosphatase 1